MRALVHFGTSKTGSTALQKAFAGARAGLRAKGVLYPDVTRQPHHVFLLPAFFEADEWKRELGPDTPETRARVTRSSRQAWERLREQVAGADCGTILISTEHVAGLRDGTKARFLQAVGAAIGPVALAGYVRSPASHYLSSIQQALKFSAVFAPPGRALGLKANLSALQRVAGAPPLVRVFSRRALHRGDVVDDFLHHHLGLEAGEVAGLARLDDNSSLSAEGMALMQQFNRDAWGGKVPFGSAVNRKLIRLIQFEEAKRGYGRPRLLDHVAELQDAANRADLLWLRETFGLVFDDHDYDRPARAAAAGRIAETAPGAFARVEDVCAVDAERLAFMRNVILRKLIGRGD